MYPGRTSHAEQRDGDIGCCCDKTPVNSSWFEDTVHHGEEDMVAVVCGGLSLHICSQEPEQEDCCSVMNCRLIFFFVLYSKATSE